MHIRVGVVFMTVAALAAGCLVGARAASAADAPATASAPATQWGKPVQTDIQSGKSVMIKSADRDIDAWLVEPKVTGKHPSVILIPDIFGLSDFIKSQADLYAHQGYTVIVPNLYAREPNDGKGLNAQTAWVAYDHMSDRQAMDDIHAAIEYLEADGQPTLEQPIGAVGIDMGGSYAMMAAGTEQRISAAVNFYGRILYRDTTPARPLSPVEQLTNLNVPILSFYGLDDPQVPAVQVKALESRLGTNPNKIYYEVIKLPGIGHGFIDPARQGYNPPAANSAAEKTKSFLARYLRAEPPKDQPPTE